MKHRCFASLDEINVKFIHPKNLNILYSSQEETRMFQEAHSPGLKACMTREAEDAKAAYNEAKRLAKHVVWQAKSVAEREKFSNIAPNDTGIFKLAKQMDKTNQDVVGEKCVRNDAGELSLSDEEKMKAWVEH